MCARCDPTAVPDSPSTVMGVRDITWDNCMEILHGTIACGYYMGQFHGDITWDNYMRILHGTIALRYYMGQLHEDITRDNCMDILHGTIT
jgi:hypothetical protein